MELNLNDKVVLVCGASKGLGYAVAKEFCNEGTHTIICSSNEKNISQAAHNLKQETGTNVYPFKADLTDKTEISVLTEYVIKKFGKVDILVNNAGGPPAGFFMDFSDEEWAKAYNLTLSSAIFLTKQLLPEMIKQHWGRIINLTSISVKQPIDNLILSNSIRMAVIGWAKTISNQYAKDGITVNNIATGYTLTERVKILAENVAKNQGITVDQVISGWKDKIPAGRLAQPEEIAGMVLFLASDNANYITGTTIPIDGGYVQSML